MARVLPYYYPPTLLAHQALVLLSLQRIGWRLNSRWLRDLRRLLRVAAGATHYGCFGYAVHPVFEVTALCNLRCLHCHAKGGQPYPGELDTRGALRVIDNLTTVKEFRMLVFTGGEPLVRRDIFELTSYASSLGFPVVYATNATLVTRDIARKMSRHGVVGAAVSLDSLRPAVHDRFRGVKGSWERAVRGMRYIVEEGMYLQINITASKLNYHEIPDLIRFADKLGAHVVLLYHFVEAGRGEANRWLGLGPEEYTRLVERVLEVQKEVELVIAPVALPWYYAYLVRRTGIPPSIARNWITGCIAARGMFYIKPNGDVWPCPFLPLRAGNVYEQPASEIWESPLFKAIRNRENLKGRCRTCSFREVCGGCRARAYAATGDPLSSDPSCRIRELGAAQ